MSAAVIAFVRDNDHPNIIFIMSDDHAAHAIGAYGSRVNQTPNIDRLAREGTILTRVFATNSICTPSRAAILTGQYSHVNGVRYAIRSSEATRKMTSNDVHLNSQRVELF